MNPTTENSVTIGGATLGWVRLLVRQLRLYQWAKNALLFIPLLATHRLGDRSLWVRNLLAFLSFGLVASSVYVLNDLSDLEADRRHPRKRFRPLASGDLPAAVGKALVPVGVDGRLKLVGRRRSGMSVVFLHGGLNGGRKQR